MSPTQTTAQNSPDEKLVYLALKGVFKGQDAQIRREKKVRKLIQRHQNQSDIRSLIQKHSLDSLCHVARMLLEEQVFESTLKAKIRFPDIFKVSPIQTAERTISESKAAKIEAAAIQGVMGGRQDEASGHEGKLDISEEKKRNEAGMQSYRVKCRPLLTR